MLLKKMLLFLVMSQCMYASQNVKLHQPRESSLLRVMPFTRCLPRQVWQQYVFPYLTVHSFAPNLGSIQLDHPSLTFNHPKGKVENIRISNDGSKVAILGYNTVYLCDTAVGHINATFKHDDGVVDLQFNKEDTLLATTTDKEVRIWDLPSGAIKNSYKCLFSIRGLMFYNTDCHLVISTSVGVMVADMVKGSMIRDVRTIHYGRIVFDQHNKDVYIIDCFLNYFVKFDLQTGNRERFDGGSELLTGNNNYYLACFKNNDTKYNDLFRISTQSKEKLEVPLLKYSTYFAQSDIFLVANCKAMISPPGRPHEDKIYALIVKVFDLISGDQLMQINDRLRTTLYVYGNKIATVAKNQVTIWDISALTHPLTLEQAILLKLLAKQKNSQIISGSICLKQLAKKYAVDHQDLRRAVLTIGNVQLRDAIINNYRLKEFMKQPEIQARR